MVFQSPHTEAFKAEVVRDALETDAAKASRKHGLNEKTVRAWVREREAVKEIVARHIKKHSGSRVLVCPDLHCPFEHPDALEFLKAVRDAYKTDTFVCLGDELDLHSISDYPTDPDGMNIGKELAEGIERLRPFYRAFPEALVCESNHTMRLWKRAFRAGLPAAFLPTVSKALDAPDGWVWKRFHTIDGVLYAHGDNGKSGQYAAANYMKQAKRSVVIGHIHAYGSVFWEGPHFGMNAGCLIDRDTYCFKYARGAMLDVSIGCGVVLEGKQAYFIPMLMDDNRRWTGKL